MKFDRSSRGRRRVFCPRRSIVPLAPRKPRQFVHAPGVGACTKLVPLRWDCRAHREQGTKHSQLCAPRTALCMCVQQKVQPAWWSSRIQAAMSGLDLGGIAAAAARRRAARIDVLMMIIIDSPRCRPHRHGFRCRRWQAVAPRLHVVRGLPQSRGGVWTTIIASQRTEWPETRTEHSSCQKV